MDEIVSNEIIVGILTKNCNKGQLLRHFPDLKGIPFVATSYAGYVSSCGMVPFIIDCDMSDDEARNVYDSIHGIILPGGNACLKTSNYHRLATLFWEWSAQDYDKKNRYFPILGICLGHQLLLRICENKNENCLTITNNKDVNLPLDFISHADSRLFHTDMSEDVRKYFTTENITFNFHKFSILQDTFEEHEKIKATYRVLAKSSDPFNGTQFIAAIESKRYPFYGVQWHPEKNAHETDPLICHTEHSMQCSKYIIDFFAKECKKGAPKIKKDYRPYIKHIETRDTSVLKKRRQILMVIKN